jgi:hypothetical protein
MKVKMIVLAIAAAGLTASAALAAPPATHPGKGTKPLTTGTGCKPQVMVVLHGTVAAAPGATPVFPFNLMVSVSSANHQGKAFVNATQPLTVSVTSTTKISRQDTRALSSLLAGDKLTVKARTCRADLAAGATPALTATTLNAHPATS